MTTVHHLKSSSLGRARLFALLALLLLVACTSANTGETQSDASTRPDGTAIYDGAMSTDSGTDAKGDAPLDATVDAPAEATTPLAACASMTLGPAGGTLQHPLGAAISVPAGALAAATTLSLCPTAAT